MDEGGILIQGMLFFFLGVRLQYHSHDIAIGYISGRLPYPAAVFYTSMLLTSILGNFLWVPKLFSSAVQCIMDVFISHYLFFLGVG